MMLRNYIASGSRFCLDISHLPYRIQHKKKVASILSIKPTKKGEYITSN